MLLPTCLSLGNIRVAREREAAISIVYYCVVSTRFQSQPRLSLRLLRCSVYYSTSTMLLSPHLFVQGMSDL